MQHTPVSANIHTDRIVSCTYINIRIKIIPFSDFKNVYFFIRIKRPFFFLKK